MNKPIDITAKWSAPAMPDLPDTLATASSVQAGPPITPLTRLMTYTADHWEAFINEWITFLPIQFLSVQRYTGPGDKGVDIAAF